MIAALIFQLRYHIINPLTIQLIYQVAICNVRNFARSKSKCWEFHSAYICP